MQFEKLALTNEVRLVEGALCAVYVGVSPSGQQFEVLVAHVAPRFSVAQAARCPKQQTPIAAAEAILREQVAPLLRVESMVLVVQSRCGCVGSIVVEADDLGATAAAVRQFAAIANQGGKASLRVRVDGRKLHVEPTLDVNRPVLAN